MQDLVDNEPRNRPFGAATATDGVQLRTLPIIIITRNCSSDNANCAAHESFYETNAKQRQALSNDPHLNVPNLTHFPLQVQIKKSTKQNRAFQYEKKDRQLDSKRESVFFFFFFLIDIFLNGCDYCDNARRAALIPNSDH